MPGFVETTPIHDVAEEAALHRLRGRPLLVAADPPSVTIKVPADWRLEDAGGQSWIIWRELSGRSLMLNVRNVIMVEEAPQ